MTTAQSLFALPSTFPGLDVLSSNAIYLMGCANFSQCCCTLRSLIDPSRFCPFCTAELTRRGRKPLGEVNDWILLDNEFRNARTVSQMLLIVPKRHVTTLSDLSPGDWKDVGALLDMSGIENGGALMRFGDPHYHAGTIEHLHINVIEPVPGNELRLPLAKTEPDHKENYERLLGFRAQLADKGGKAWLFSDEGINETQPKKAA
jgi:diadenosine tetraphosphate (Ap4A) HIT family hydrolase